MSDVKKLLEAQQSDFISLHDLLVKMQQQGGGCTLKEAATVLYRLLYQNRESNGYDNPCWYQSDIRGVVNVTFEGMNQIDLVKQIATTGTFEVDNEPPF